MPDKQPANAFNDLLKSVGIDFVPPPAGDLDPKPDAVDEALAKGLDNANPEPKPEPETIFDANVPSILIKSTHPLASKDDMVVIDRSADAALADSIESGGLPLSWAPRGTGMNPLQGGPYGAGPWRPDY